MNPVRITNSAWNKINNILKKSNNNLGFLYSVSRGGGGGFNFELNLLEKNIYNDIKKIVYLQFHHMYYY